MRGGKESMGAIDEEEMREGWGEDVGWRYGERTEEGWGEGRKRYTVSYGVNWNGVNILPLSSFQICLKSVHCSYLILVGTR